MVRRLAAEKALAAQKPMPDVVLAADTAVVLDGRIFGKPRDQADAQSMLLQLSGRSHLVMTGVAMRCDGNERCILSTSRVTFREISPDEACAYWQSGESGDKAGAYAIQGLGGVFVERIEGSYSGVVGLPVLETAALLAIAGIDVIKNAAEARAADK
jgi:septum formation protein